LSHSIAALFISHDDLGRPESDPIVQPLGLSVPAGFPSSPGEDAPSGSYTTGYPGAAPTD
ncbi:MAG: hypothetical protein JWN61_577, partial [Pseudonocardiales bacterium]|nr:hypothetical protein [Pseudonocardiales bacterium]